MTKNVESDEVLSFIRNHEDDIVGTIREFVARDSSSRNPETAAEFCLWLMKFFEDDGYECRILDAGKGGGVLSARCGRGGSPVLLGGHYDTVLPDSANRENPFRIDGDRIYGSGTIDMKGGIVLGVWAVRALRSAGIEPCVEFLIDGDEETCHRGSDSAEIVIRESAGCSFALSLETGRNPVSAARRGLCRCAVTIRVGKGFNAIQQMAERCLEISRLTDIAGGVSANISILRGNRDIACATIDFRCSAEEQQKHCMDVLEKTFESVEEVAVITKEYTHFMPVFEDKEENHLLLSFLNEVSSLYGLPHLEGSMQSGSSDVSLYQKAGVPALCSLGAIGDGMHTTHEYCLRSKIFERCALIACCLMHSAQFCCAEPEKEQ